ncbi:MAG: muconolactone Delta-isomerase family protein [Actinobacteria bacterium]|nr:muconolactone Delta-isomerase family protein [Actinomycetota bacterium]
MSEFLVEIAIRLPSDVGEAERARLLADEAAQGRRLRASGSIVRLWRVPGRFANVGIWAAADATELHALLMSLPLYPFADIDVRPLARHPLEE